MPSSEVRGALKGVDFPVNCRQRRTSVDDGEEVHKRGSVCVCVCVCVRERERGQRIAVGGDGLTMTMTLFKSVKVEWDRVVMPLV